jgi:hypothetical protein
MYFEETSVEIDRLRQGDIVKDVHALGVINLNGISYITDEQGNKKGWTVLDLPIFTNVMVLSHSCEIDLTNGIKLTSLILAPLRDINSATRQDKIDELKASNIIKPGITQTYLKYFYIEPHPNIYHENGSVVDFSKCFSVRKNCYDLLVKNKVAQLKTDIANSMALKCALYFSR